ncbi:MAG: M13 family metallopeptidase [Acidobacteriaceae bacterium]|nr:M13 family metallopeptidase [Acidobacteriaceae bacterium]
MKQTKWTFALAISIVSTLLCADAQNKSSADTKPTLPPGLDRRLIDTSADPCVNFYQYACGNFPKVFPMPPDQSRYAADTVVTEYTEYTLRSLLEKAATANPSRTPNEQKIGDYYASCMDTSTIDDLGLKPLQPELDRITALTDKKQLSDLLAHFQLINVNAFIGFGEQQDFKDARKQIAYVDQGGLGLPERDYYFRTGANDEKLRQEYIQHITNTLKLLGEPQDKAASNGKKIMNLEAALAKVSMDVTSQRDPKNVYHFMAVSQLAGFTPEIDWTTFFESAGVPHTMELNVANPDFYKGLKPILASTDLETIKTYLRWQLVKGTPSVALPKTFDEEQFDFYGRKLRGQPEQRARWKRCVQATDSALGEALGEVYVKENFPASSKAATVQIVHDIEAAMDKDIDALTWMSPETKVKAKEKLHMVADKIGYPDHWRDYSRLKIVRGDAYGNAIRAGDFESRRQLAKIGKPVDRAEWITTPATVNAFYNPSMNDINFPAGILQPPFFDPNSTDAVNYGQTGTTVGHELSHGFDDQGRQFDGNGNLVDWWTPEDAKQFDQKADCEVKEYGGFTAVDDVKINGKLTLGENTADNGGLRLAYMAFLEDAKRKNIEPAAKDASGYNPLQQFFIAYGQSWCGSTRPELLRLQVQTNSHSPEIFRVNGVVQNMREFGEAFGCKPGQPMMPVNSCRVW